MIILNKKLKAKSEELIVKSEKLRTKNESLAVRKNSSFFTLHFSLFFLLLSFSGMFGQSSLSSDQNYIYTKNCLNEDCSKKTEAVQYSDDLGRTTQTIAIKATPSGKDVVTPFEYDAFGRQVKSYMPFPQTGTQNGAFYSNPKANASQSYGSDPNFFSFTELEKSPSAKVLSTTKPGADFQGRSAQFGYEVNGNNDVKKYTIATSWQNGATDNSISLSGNYAAGILMKTSVTDEDGNVSIEFTNGKGQTVLARRVLSSSQNSDTYYVYNKYGQLAYVIPPLAVNEPLNQTTLDNLCYQYRYDSKGRQIEKKLPGKGWEYSVYDFQGRLLMSQDANMGLSKQWLFSKYDVYGRTVYTGIYTSSQDYGSAGRQAEQNFANTATVYHETRNTGGFDAGGVTAYYTHAAYPVAFTKIFSVNYYDTYPQGTPERPSQVLGKNTIGDNMAQPINTKNLPTASLVKNLEDDNWTKSFIWYDEKARAVGTHSVNHLGGYTKTETLPDFAGVPQQTKTYHKRIPTDTEKIITQDFEYDPQNRLKKHYHQVNSQPQELLSENTYNELSQLSNKKVGNNLQSIDYTYNMRGALVKMNDPDNQGTKLFAYELKYYNPASTATGKRTNNIAEVLWKTASDNVLRKYSYQYDALNRMTAGMYSEPNVSVPKNDFYNETVTYDLGGNIKTLQRNGKNALNALAKIDDLTYDYTGNRLNSVIDDSNDYNGYPEVSGTVITYDANGNMINHMDKGILQIDYNILDLPRYIKFDKTYNPRFGFEGVAYNVNTQYLYRADGVKLKKVYTYGSGKANSEINDITEYLDGFQYEATDTGSKFSLGLKFVPTAEGYYNFEKNQYIYSYVDHLGNVRLSYFKNATGSAEVLEENNFYPFGLKHDGYNALSGNPAYNYEYSGKELQKETGWSDFGARMYMADIGRWGVIDPLAETTTRVNPYNYALNNPVMFIDPDGRKAYDPEVIFGDYARGGALEFYMSGGFATFGSFEEFLGTNPYDLYRKGRNGVYGGDAQVRTPKKKGDPNQKVSTWTSIKNFFSRLFGGGKKKSSNKVSVGEAEGSFDDGTRLFGLIKNANVNANGESPLEQYRAWRNYPLYHEGESWLDRFARNVNATHMDIMLDEGSGGGLMYGGFGRVANAAGAVEEAGNSISKILSSTGEFDPLITLYRGTGGSESGSVFLYLTDNVGYASSFVKNGGQVMKYQISKSGLYILEHTNGLTVGQGQHFGVSGTFSEYKFMGKDVVEAVNKLGKPHVP